MPHFGATLRLLRIESGISLRSLAQRIGVSGAYLSRVENAHDPVPTPDRLLAIAKVLGIPGPVMLDLAQQTGTAVSGYLQRVPAASSLFLEIAERDLGAGQIARIKAFLDSEFPDRNRRQEARPRRLRELLSPSRVVLKLACSDLEDLIDVAVARLPASRAASGSDLARRILEREELAPSALGAGFAAPYAVVRGTTTAAALVTLASPLAIDTPDRRPVSVAIVLVLGEGDAPLDILTRVARLAGDSLAADLRAADTPGRALSLIEKSELLW
jgi:PTS system nitrogen regulatory IIA component